MSDHPTITLPPSAVVHSVTISWKDGVGPDHGVRVAAALNSYAVTVPGLLFYHAGPDLGLRENTADFGIVALFDNRDNYVTYARDAQHQAIIAELVAPNARERISAQAAFSGSLPLSPSTPVNT
ncbi:conserved hypothetical protein (plasmid) [Rhodococcus jostii RHA1]|uniref:Stress-response A/B barrel domain-containing protein n=1 Tax=Rhodococcus jostii (strain RHA1) TaxID=101510 RepID=Q0RUT1_RHOJR|nr:Dabb family protein [Rhodococcus jostii]ABH00955.1 conserved hypothetical protein [Rhodococcus jostii RHA1]